MTLVTINPRLLVTTVVKENAWPGADETIDRELGAGDEATDKDAHAV